MHVVQRGLLRRTSMLKYLLEELSGDPAVSLAQSASVLVCTCAMGPWAELAMTSSAFWAMNWTTASDPTCAHTSHISQHPRFMPKYT